MFAHKPADLPVLAKKCPLTRSQNSPILVLVVVNSEIETSDHPETKGDTSLTMRLSLGKAVAALLASQVVEGSFLRDVVGIKATKKSLEQELLAKAIPLDDYRANLRARGYDIVQDSRRLDQAGDMGADDYYLNENYMYSFKGYSLKYAACQPVQKFSEEAVSAGEYTPMITDDIVILRLCPSSSCSSNRAFGCLYNYAEYAVAVNDYVRIMLRYKMDKQEELCNWCDSCSRRRHLNEGEGNEDAQAAQNNADNGNEANQEGQGENNEEEANQEQDNAEAAGDAGDEGVAEEDAAADEAAGDDATSSSGNANDDDNGQYSQGDDCYKFKTYCYSDGVSVCAEDNDDGNYLDTEDYLNYMECTHANGYYLRPRCNGYDHTISMGIFYDKFCSQYAGDKVNMNSLGLRISPNAFQEFYAKTSCLDCTESVRTIILACNQCS